MAAWLLNLDPQDTTASPDELASLDAALDAPAVSSDSATAPDELTSLDVSQDAPSCSSDSAAAPDELGALAVAQDDPTGAYTQNASPDDAGSYAIASDDPSIAVTDTTAQLDDAPQLDVTGDNPDVAFTATAGPDDHSIPVDLDNPTLDQFASVGPDAYGLDLTCGTPDISINDLLVDVDDGPQLGVNLDDAAAGEIDYTQPSDDVALTVTGDNPAVAFAVTTGPDGLAVDITIDDPTGAVTFNAGPTPLGLNLLGDNPAVSLTAGPDDLNLPVALDTPSTTWSTAFTPPNLGTIPIALTAPTFLFAPDDTSATPHALHILLTPGEPGQPDTVDPVITPIVSTRYAPPTPAYHLLGIGPWNSSIIWRGAPNYGLGAGQRASVPHLTLPDADSKTVTLRLNAASEASTSHTFYRDNAVLIQENATDLWWRRRDPRRAVVEVLGRFNAASVDISLDTNGATGVSASYVDYQGLLEDRLVLQYKDTVVIPHTIQWAANTLIVDILRWAVPTNMGIDLTGIQTLTPDTAAKVKTAFEIPLGTPIGDVFTQLQAVSDLPWEWWVTSPTSDTDRPRLTIATARGTDRGVSLINVGSHGPIESASLQRNGDKYANALYFIGEQGGGVYTYDDQIALYGQRDAMVNDDTIKATSLDAAGAKKLAELAAATPSYQVVLRQGFWEGRGHIDVGDWVSLRLAFGSDIVSGKWRVGEIQIDIDSSGYETVTLTIGTPRPAKDPRSRRSSTARLVRYLTNFVPHGGL